MIAQTVILKHKKTEPSQPGAANITIELVIHYLLVFGYTWVFMICLGSLHEAFSIIPALGYWTVFAATLMLVLLKDIIAPEKRWWR